MTIPDRWRKVLAPALIALGCLLAIASVAAVWLNRQVVDTDSYVSTVAPLSTDPAIQDAVAAALTDQLFAQTDAEQQLRDALPPQARFAAAPIVGAVQGFVQEQARQVLASPQFSNLWEQANRTSHELMVKALADEGGAISGSGDQVTLDLHSLAVAVRDRLDQAGVTVFDRLSLDNINTQLVLIDSPVVGQLRTLLHVLNILAFWLPFLSVVFLAAGVWLSLRRRPAFIWAALGLAAAMAVLALALAGARSYFLGAVAARSLDQAAASALFDTLVASLRVSLRAVLAVGLVGAVAAFLTGEWLYARKVREKAGQTLGRAPQIQAGRAGQWLWRYHSGLRIAAAILGLLILVLISQPSALDVAVITLVWLIFAAGLQLLAPRSGQTLPGAAAGGTPGGQAGGDSSGKDGGAGGQAGGRAA